MPYRAELGPAILDVARTRFGLDWTGEAVDAGGVNLNVHLPDAGGLGHVLRVYAPWVDEQRVRFIQSVRASLRAHGLPFTETQPTVDGDTLVLLDLADGPRVVEVDRFVRGRNMDATCQLDVGMSMLGRVHSALTDIALPTEGSAATDARFPNHMAAGQALDSATRAASVIRGWPDATDVERQVAGGMVALAATLRELDRNEPLSPQLVHGDFWDNNVLFDDEDEIVAVLDLDFMGRRPRIDDVALTFYYATSDLRQPTVSDEHLAYLRRSLDAYDAALDDPLSVAERRALPLAVARTVLFMARNIVAMTDKQLQRHWLREIVTDVVWSRSLVAERAWRAQEAFVA